MDGIFFPIIPMLFVLGIIWITNHRKLEEKRIAAAAERDRTGNTQDKGRIDELEDRVRVLERIVTDGGYDLANKIEALRDERSLETRIGDLRPSAAAARKTERTY